MTEFYSDNFYSLSSEIFDDSDVGILSFCGVGLGMGGLQINEFSKTFGGYASVVFLKDLQRSWWNNGDFADLLDKAIGHLKATGCEHIFAIGNSMGASGALLASHIRSDIKRVYAFVPQADPYADNRWNKYTNRIEDIRWKNFAELTYQSDTRIFMGDNGDDDFQIKFFQNCGKAIDLVKGGGHNAALILKKQGKYKEIIDDFLVID